MTINLDKAGKRFNREWIFRNLSYNFLPGNFYAITGPNGSGKSTLLQAIAGAISLSEGNIHYSTNSIRFSNEDFYSYISVSAPYLEIIEEMTAIEFLRFHQTFKPLVSDISISEILTVAGLSEAADKQIRFYSSGMKQRIKLVQAIFSDVPILLLDEPCTNLDTNGYELYRGLISNYCRNKLVIVSSNDVNEYDFCGEHLTMPDYK